MIRHGESEANRQGVFAGQIDPDLADKGLKQAELTAKYIVEHYKVDKIYSSDLQRAYKTALCLAKMLNVEVQREKNLREIDGGKWEGMSFDELPSLYPDEYHTWLNNIGNSCCVGGESVKQLGERVMNVLTGIAEKNVGKTVAIATHATSIRVAQTLIQTGTLEEMHNIPWVSNASVTVFQYSDHEWKIIAVSMDEHLAELKTVLPLNV